MSVDYDGIGGIGLHWDKIKDQLQEAGLYSEDGKTDLDDDIDAICKKIGTSYALVGNCYSGDTSYVLLVKGENLSEVNENAKKLIEKLAELGVQINESDLEVISEICIS